MRDFSLESYEQERFILYYEKKEKSIITHLANGNIKTELYTRGTEDLILSKMEEQIDDYEEDVLNYYNNLSKNFVLHHLPILSACSASSILTTCLDTKVAIPAFLLLGFETIRMSKSGIDYFKTKEDMKDYKKHKLFLDNKDVINKSMNFDMRLLSGFPKQVLKEVKSNIQSRGDAININTVRLLKQEELERIIELAKEDIKKYSPNQYRLKKDN